MINHLRTALGGWLFALTMKVLPHESASFIALAVKAYSPDDLWERHQVRRGPDGA